MGLRVPLYAAVREGAGMVQEGIESGGDSLMEGGLVILMRMADELGNPKAVKDLGRMYVAILRNDPDARYDLWRRTAMDRLSDLGLPRFGSSSASEQLYDLELMMRVPGDLPQPRL
tara:strand:+ start:953 stop:1300 length:348 start_codon:yes stop_codon:yes gene_type:complete